MLDKLREWWTFDEDREKASADNPQAPLTDAQRRDTFPLLTLAFGWGFLVTGLATGGGLGAGLPFWPDLVTASFLGNLINFVIGALIGYAGYKTACNSGLLYRYVYGTGGAVLPVVFIALMTVLWQGIVVGMFGFAWAQSFDSNTFYAVAVFGGLLFTVTTYFGVRGLELVSIPAVVILVLVGLYAGVSNVMGAGGWGGFLALSAETSKESPLTMVHPRTPYRSSSSMCRSRKIKIERDFGLSNRRNEFRSIPPISKNRNFSGNAKYSVSN